MHRKNSENAEVGLALTITCGSVTCARNLGSSFRVLIGRRATQLKASETRLETERIHRRRAGRGIVKDAPNLRTRAALGCQLMRKALELVGTVFRIINAWRPVQSKVKKAVPFTRLGDRAHDRRVGGDAADPKLRQ